MHFKSAPVDTAPGKSTLWPDFSTSGPVLLLGTAAAPVSWRLTSTQMVDSDTFLWHIPSYGTGSSSVLEVLWDEEQLGQIPRSLLRIAHILEELSQAFACMIFEISMQMEHLYCKHKSPHDLWSLNAGMIFEVSTAATKDAAITAWEIKHSAYLLRNLTDTCTIWLMNTLRVSFILPRECCIAGLLVGLASWLAGSNE